MLRVNEVIQSIRMRYLTEHLPQSGYGLSLRYNSDETSEPDSELEDSRHPENKLEKKAK